MACLDTSVLIAFLKGDATVISLVHSLAEKGVLRTTTITEYELMKHRETIKRKLAEELMSVLEICPFDSRAAREAAEIFESLSKNGRLINENDILIAGIAFSSSDTLVTRDKDFKSMDGKDVLII